MPWILIGSLVASLIAGESAPPSVALFELSRLNRDFENPVEELAPWQQGAMTVELSSSRHRLTLLSNRVALRRQPRGTFLAAVELSFTGEGDVIADLTVGQVGHRFEDHLVVPRQERTLWGEIRIERLAAGYRITTLRLPERLSIRIESGLATRLIEACQGLAAFPLLPISCDALARSLGELTVRLPAAGGVYLLPAGELTDRERASLEAFLAGSP